MLQNYQIGPIRGPRSVLTNERALKCTQTLELFTTTLFLAHFYLCLFLLSFHMFLLITMFLKIRKKLFRKFLRISTKVRSTGSTQKIQRKGAKNCLALTYRSSQWGGGKIQTINWLFGYFEGTHNTNSPITLQVLPYMAFKQNQQKKQRTINFLCSSLFAVSDLNSVIALSIIVPYPSFKK